MNDKALRILIIVIINLILLIALIVTSYYFYNKNKKLQIELKLQQEQKERKQQEASRNIENTIGDLIKNESPVKIEHIEIIIQEDLDDSTISKRPHQNTYLNENDQFRFYLQRIKHNYKVHIEIPLETIISQGDIDFSKDDTRTIHSSSTTKTKLKYGRK